MTYEQLSALVAVVDSGTFSAAARRLAKSQPAVSKLVKSLEERLGFDVIDRSGYRPVPTPRGQLFVERAKQVLLSTESLEAFGAQLAGDIEASVRVAVEAIYPLTPVIQALAFVRQQFPTTRIELSKEPMARAARQVATGSIDIAISSEPGRLRSVERVAIRNVRILPVAHVDHPLAAVVGEVPQALLVQHPQIVLSDAEPDAAAINVIEGGLRWRVDDVAAKLAIIQAGLGWGGLPEHVVADALRGGELVVLDLKQFEVRAIQLHLLRARNPPAGPAAQALWNRLIHSARRPRITKIAPSAATGR